jgi:hypothetical protein
MGKIKVFNQINRVVIFDESGHELAPLEEAEVDAGDPIAAFAIEKGYLVVLSSNGVVEEAAPEVEPIQVEEEVSEPEPEVAEEQATEVGEESQEETPEETPEEAPEEAKPTPRTRKKTSTQVKES